MNVLKIDYQRYYTNQGNFFRFFYRFITNACFRANILYRLGHWCKCHKMNITAGICERLMHHLCHCWISVSADIGSGLMIAHVGTIVIGGRTQMGKNCDIRQNITIGGNFSKVNKSGQTMPIIGDNVSIGAGAVILGPVKIGSNSIIGANAVVIHDIPDNVIAAGNPAKVINKRWSTESGRKL